MYLYQIKMKFSNFVFRGRSEFSGDTRLRVLLIYSTFVVKTDRVSLEIAKSRLSIKIVIEFLTTQYLNLYGKDVM